MGEVVRLRSMPTPPHVPMFPSLFPMAPMTPMMPMAPMPFAPPMPFYMPPFGSNPMAGMPADVLTAMASLALYQMPPAPIFVPDATSAEEFLPEQNIYARRLRMRGLPFNATDEDVRQFFAAEGEEEWIAEDTEDQPAIKVQKRNNGRPTGIAIVHLKAGLEFARVSEALEGKPMGDRYIEVFAADEK